MKTQTIFTVKPTMSNQKFNVTKIDPEYKVRVYMDKRGEWTQSECNAQAFTLSEAKYQACGRPSIEVKVVQA